MNITIRQCQISELDTLQEIAHDTYNETFGSMNGPEIMEQYLKEAFNKERLWKELNNRGSQFYFLFLDTELAGYLKINEAPAQSDINDAVSLEIERIYIRQKYKGRGLGRSLMEFALQQAIKMKKHYI